MTAAGCLSSLSIGGLYISDRLKSGDRKSCLGKKENQLNFPSFFPLGAESSCEQLMEMPINFITPTKSIL